jgi:dihydroneopterin aldolase
MQPIDDKKSPQYRHIANGKSGLRHVFVRDLILAANIGAYEHEKKHSQSIRVNVDLTVKEDPRLAPDDLGNVVCYDQIVQNIKAVVSKGHINLVETMAEEFAEISLEDSRVLCARIRVEKLAAIPEAESVGVEIERYAIL